MSSGLHRSICRTRNPRRCLPRYYDHEISVERTSVAEPLKKKNTQLGDLPECAVRTEHTHTLRHKSTRRNEQLVDYKLVCWGEERNRRRGRRKKKLTSPVVEGARRCVSGQWERKRVRDVRLRRLCSQSLVVVMALQAPAMSNARCRHHRVASGRRLATAGTRMAAVCFGFALWRGKKRKKKYAGFGGGCWVCHRHFFLSDGAYALLPDRTVVQGGSSHRSRLSALPF